MPTKIAQNDCDEHNHIGNAKITNEKFVLEDFNDFYIEEIGSTPGNSSEKEKVIMQKNTIKKQSPMMAATGKEVENQGNGLSFYGNTLPQIASKSDPVEYRLHWVKKAFEEGLDFVEVNKDKQPFEKGWTTRRKLTLEQTLEAARRNNIAIRTGSKSGIVIVDVDKGGETPESLKDIPTWRVLTPRGVEHIYFKAPEEQLAKPPRFVAEHVDFLAENRCAVFPGSIHPNGGMYRWKHGCSPDDVKLAELPGWIVDMYSKKTKSKSGVANVRDNIIPINRAKIFENLIAKHIETMRNAKEGQRNVTLNRCAFALGQLSHSGISRESVESRLKEAAINTGLDDDEADATFESGWSSGVDNPSCIVGQEEGSPSTVLLDHDDPTTNLAHVRRLEQHFGDSLRHSTEYGWLYWNDVRWEANEKSAIYIGSKLGQLVRQEASDHVTDAKQAEAYFKQAKYLESHKGMGVFSKLCKWPSVKAEIVLHI